VWFPGPDDPDVFRDILGPVDRRSASLLVAAGAVLVPSEWHLVEGPSRLAVPVFIPAGCVRWSLGDGP
jgi:hypothetical protein